MHTPRTSQHGLPNRRRGAVMVETVLILPLIMVVIVLIIYLGWNIRRLEKATSMDRYEAWRAAMPGTPGPARNDDEGHPALNQAFFGDTGDQATDITEDTGRGRGPIPEAHDLLLTQLSEEEFAFFQNFLDDQPSTIYERFNAEHDAFSPMLDRLGLSNMTRNHTGHTILNGDWRFADGIRFDQTKNKWEPGSRRISPSPALSEVFFIQLDEDLTPIVAGDNPLAEATRNFYTRYPEYRGPDINTGTGPSN